MENQLKNKIAVITGGCGQVGYATAVRLANQGARIFSIVRRDLEHCQTMMNRLPNSDLGHRAFLASITDTASIKTAVKEISQLEGKCDILVNAAGITKSISPKFFDRYTDEMFDEIIISNLRGPFATIREFHSLLQNSGEALVVNITSTAGVRSSNSNLAYGAAKCGLELITKSLSKVLAPNIRMVAISPGILENCTSGAVKPEDYNEKMSKEIPLGRVGNGQDVAKTIEALATSLTYINGSTILLDGGRLA